MHTTPIQVARRIRRIEGAVVLPLDGADGRAGAARSIDIDERGRIAALDAPFSVGSVGLAEDTILDLRAHPGATVVPGFIDAHLHLVLGGISLTQLDLGTVDSREAFESAVSAHAERLADDEWLIGWGWSEENWGDHTDPDQSWLRSAGARPALCWRMDHHACVVNAAALARLREAHPAILDRLQRDPPGGRIVRDEFGAPTGMLLEAAAWKLAKPLVPEPSIERRRDAVRAAMALLNRQGVVACGSMEYAAELRETIEPLRGVLSVRIHATLLDRDWPIDLGLAEATTADEMLRVIGYKAFADGTLGSRTAAMLDTYHDDPGNRGTLVELAESGLLREWIQAVAERGLSPSVHAIGDRAMRLVLDTAEALGVGDALRIEHAQTVHPDDLPRMRNRWASMQPLHRADDGRSAERRLGLLRMDRFFPFRRLVEHGARLAFGSDWPIVAPDVIAGIRAAVTGLDLDGRAVEADQALTPLEALHAYTRGAAECLRMAGGRIVAGAAADLTVLSADPLRADWIGNPPTVLATVVDGRLVMA